MFNFMAFWGNYWEGIVAALIVCIISIILQIPYAEDDAPDPDWWQTLSQSPHARLCLPPNCFSRVGGQLATMSTKPISTQSTSATPVKESAHDTSKIYSQLTSVLQLLPVTGLSLHPENVPDNCSPLVCFVNSRSGGYQGAFVISQLRKLLNPNQVCDLATSDPAAVLKEFSVLPALRILACGGDGTVGWILNCIAKLPEGRRPPVAILPLGTGNDLARVLGWGSTANGVTLPILMQQIQRASITILDRWQLEVKSGGKVTKSLTFNNYFGVGVDAQIVLKFHLLREKAPERFFSQFTNKVWYGIMGLQELWRSNCAGMSSSVQLFADGVEIEIPEDAQGFVFLNISSYGGGVKLWANDRGMNGGSSSSHTSLEHSSDDEPSLSEGSERSPRAGSSKENNSSSSKPMHWQNMSIQDGLMEVVAITSPLQLARVKFGLEKCQKLAQATEFEIRSKRSLPLQADGEPWGEAPCTITIRPAGQALMLKQTTDCADSDITHVLEWAERNTVISAHQKLLLLHEFSKLSEMRADRTLGENFERIGSQTFGGSTLDLLSLTNGSHGNL